MYTFCVSALCILILNSFVPSIGKAITYLNSSLLQYLPDNITTSSRITGELLLIFTAAILISAVKLHDRLSDILRIRNEFDIHYVLYPLVAASGATLSATQFNQVRLQRRRLMTSCFYAYASSTTPTIDRHTISQALTNWSWFWVSLEAISLFFTTAIVLMCYAAWMPAALLLMGCLMLLLFMRYFRLQSASYAERQVKQILHDETRRSQIADTFNAL